MFDATASPSADQPRIIMHAKGFFLPATYRLFGTTFVMIPTTQDENVFNRVRFFARKVIHRKISKSNDYPCNDQDKDLSIRTCLKKALRDCKLPWDTKSNSNSLCQPSTHTQQLINTTLTFVGESSVAQLMKTLSHRYNCPLPCTYHEFQMEKEWTHDPCIVNSSESCSGPQVRGGTTMTTVSAKGSEVELKVEQWVYSKDNFIADVGGYLGLLLGVSVITVYDMLVGGLRKEKVES